METRADLVKAMNDIIRACDRACAIAEKADAAEFLVVAGLHSLAVDARDVVVLDRLRGKKTS